MSVLIREVSVQGYEDLQILEGEICRLLRCDASRRPACLSSENFLAFKGLVMDCVHHGGSQKASCHLSQNLDLHLELPSSTQQAAVVKLMWS
jgi:hypothetical protein